VKRTGLTLLTLPLLTAVAVGCNEHPLKDAEMMHESGGFGSETEGEDESDGETDGDDGDESGGEHVVHARREVVVSAGAVNSPKLLQLSGIGPAALLNDLGVPVRAALKGVGENLRDHYSVRMTARARNVRTINEYARWPRLPLEFAKWAAGKPSVLAICPTIAFVHGKSHPDLDDSDLRILFTPGSYMDGRVYVLDDHPGMTCGAAQPRPESSGYVRAVSRNPADAPIVQPNYLAAETDQRITLAGLRLAVMAEETLRTERRQPVTGLVVLAHKSDQGVSG